MHLKGEEKQMRRCEKKAGNVMIDMDMEIMALAL